MEKKMKRRDDEWLDKKIAEDLMAMADAREKYLMEAEELQNIDMTPEKMEEIRQEVARRTRKKSRKRLHLRAVLVAAAIMVLFVGAGVVSSGKKLFVPVIFQRERGNEITTKINNTDAIASQYDEEEVCQEIEEKLGVIPVRFGYQPKDIKITEYILDEISKEAIIRYQFGENNLHIYISKDYKNATISYQTDGEILDTIMIESCGMEIPLYIVDDSSGGEFYNVKFEYLNTYYVINGTMEKDVFSKILENIVIKNV